MEIDRTGIILYTIAYKKCVDFYSDILQLNILFETAELTCFAFGASYLLVEMSDEYEQNQSKDTRIKTCLRMNVPDVRKVADELIAKNIAVDYQEYSWGTVAKFLDPDGNLCAIKDSKKFEKQISEHLNQN